jgi:polysaccharide biosynthesis protein PslH
MKKVLVINPVPLVPTKAMSQVRTLNMIKSLAGAFEVDVLAPYTSESSKGQIAKFHAELGTGYIGIKSQKSSDRLFKKRLNQLLDRIFCFITGTDMDRINGKRYENAILKIIGTNQYDFVISNYWEFSGFFIDLKDIKTTKILDTHYAVQENLEVYGRNKYKNSLSFIKKRELKKSLKLEDKVANNSDIIVSLSVKSEKILKDLYPGKIHIMIPDGNDVEYFASRIRAPEPNTLLFYGSMSSLQNQRAFFLFYRNILPIIRSKIPEIKVLVVGNNPPASISKLNGKNGIQITGFVKDIRDWLWKGVCMILPLEIGSGFRGRIVEVMAMGIPVIGTHNALDSIGMESGKQGFVSDNNIEMAEYAIKLFKDKILRDEISANCLKFARTKYSLEATFDRFTEFLVKY